MENKCSLGFLNCSLYNVCDHGNVEIEEIKLKAIAKSADNEIEMVSAQHTLTLLKQAETAKNIKNKESQAAAYTNLIQLSQDARLYRRCFLCKKIK